MPYKMKITGEVSVRPCRTVKSNSARILIMGPTGAGKSAFIESLAGEGHNLGISKDQLTSYTQDVNAYELRNAAYVDDLGDKDPWPIYLIDSPGFSDAKSSEMEIMKKIKSWMCQQGIVYITHILYLCPITDTRMAGSKRRTIRMLQALIPEYSAPRINIITTMWDQITNPRARERAEARFTQLRDDIWKGFVSSGSQIAKFQNEQQSAMDIIRTAFMPYCGHIPLDRAAIKRNDPAAPFLYHELLSRINNARQERNALCFEKRQLLMNSSSELEDLTLLRLREIKQDLEKFLEDLMAFGTPPTGFEEAPAWYMYQNLVDEYEEARQEHKALRSALIILRGHPSFDETRRATLRFRLGGAEERLVISASKIVKFGTPPKGFTLVVFPLRVLSGMNRARQVLNRGMGFISRFQKP